MRRSLLIALVGIVVLLAAALIFSVYNHPDSATAVVSSTTSGQPMLPTTKITLGNTTIVAELATTPQQEESGLSGRLGLAPGTGMLFIFDPPQEPGFWMKDMLFSLDIIYAAQDGTIVTIYPNLLPATYPQSFKPLSPVQYVLEVPGGFAAAHALAVGQKIVVQ
jgi:uncharacterized membrane protein (UPF0127 family)